MLSRVGVKPFTLDELLNVHVVCSLAAAGPQQAAYLINPYAQRRLGRMGSLACDHRRLPRRMDGVGHSDAVARTRPATKVLLDPLSAQAGGMRSIRRTVAGSGWSSLTLSSCAPGIDLSLSSAERSIVGPDGVTEPWVSTRSSNPGITAGSPQLPDPTRALREGGPSARVGGNRRPYMAGVGSQAAGFLVRADAAGPPRCGPAVRADARPSRRMEGQP
jgi:hypothetical protein